jgi:hypothetical protein
MSSDGEKEALLRMIEQLRLAAAATDARMRALTEELAAVKIANARRADALPPSPSSSPALPPAVPCFSAPLASPTDGGAASLLGDGGFWGFVDAPVSFDASHAAASFSCVAAAARAAAAEAASKAPDLPAGGSPEQELMSEKTFYALAVSSLPAHIAARAGAAQASAQNVFGAGALRTSRWTFNGACKPELATAAAGSDDDKRPAFVGELKSVDRLMLGQALYYALMAITGAFFPAARGGAEPGARVFYASPPLAFALLAFPHVGYFVAVEMVGKALVSPASQPFFLGSAEHAAAVAALPAAPRGAPAWVFDADARWQAAPGASAAPVAPAVCWAISGGMFRKLVRADARSAARWAQMHAAYARLGEIWTAGERAPAALVHGARMLFGAHEAVVEMMAVDGREATDDEATGGGGDCGGGGGGAVLAAVAEAVAWLAARGLLYTDVRGPNVLVVGGGGGARLVDYDDCVVLRTPVHSAQAYREALSAVEAARAELRHLCVAPPTFAARLAAGGLPRFESALELAFQRL